MVQPLRVVVNGKFLSADSTGVHRVAGELIRNCYTLVAEDVALQHRIDMELWVPAAGVAGAKALGVPYQTISPFGGIPWEQVTLPARARGRTILSLCNVGPLATRNAVTMFHDAQVHISPASYSLGFRSWYHLHQPFAGRRHRRILTVSDFSRGQLDRYGLATPDRTGVILNGVDHVLAVPPDFRVIDRLGLQDKDFVVALANTQHHKNIGLLLKAFADPSLANLKLVLFGAAGRDDFLALGFPVPDNVIFAGRVSDQELRALYGFALCIAFPSTTEGFGLPPLEAMTTGCPAIVAPCGALPESCGPGAVYADPTDIQEWVAAIATMAQSPEFRAEMSRAALKWSAGFTWRNAASQLLQELLAL